MKPIATIESNYFILDGSNYIETNERAGIELERLTERFGSGHAKVKKEFLKDSHFRLLNKCADYEDAEEQGRLVIPCARCRHNWHKSHSTPLEMHNPCHQCAFQYPFSNFEAAESALAERNGENGNNML